MKLTFFDDYRLAAVTDDGVIPLDSGLQGMDGFPPQLVLSRVIEQWSDYGAKFSATIDTGEALDRSQSRQFAFRGCRSSRRLHAFATFSYHHPRPRDVAPEPGPMIQRQNRSTGVIKCQPIR